MVRPAFTQGVRTDVQNMWDTKTTFMLDSLYPLFLLHFSFLAFLLVIQLGFFPLILLPFPIGSLSVDNFLFCYSMSWGTIVSPLLPFFSRFSLSYSSEMVANKEWEVVPYTFQQKIRGVRQQDEASTGNGHNTNRTPWPVVGSFIHVFPRSDTFFFMSVRIVQESDTKRIHTR